MNYSRKHPKYAETLATFLNTKEGKALAVTVMSQLIDGFDVGSKGRINNVEIDTDKPIVLEFEE